MLCQKQALELFTSGTPLREVLETFVRSIESQFRLQGSIAIHLLDESKTRFEHTIAPGLSPEYIRAVDGMEVSSATGPCCAAILARRRVVVADLAGGREFPAFAAFALPLGIRAGWSTPILASTGKVLGTVAEYYSEARVPKPADHFFGDIMTRTAAIIIERRQAEETLRRVNEDLKHFAYAASHDLQEPLRMVMAYTQLLARENKGRLDPQSEQFVAYAVQGAQRMEALLRDLREYWSVNEQKIERLISVDCNHSLEKALTLLEMPIRDSGAVVTHDSLPGVMAEELPVTLLFQNLIGNAVKYRRPEAAPHIHVSARAAGARVVEFSVSDNGIGIEAEHLETIFAPFKRLHGLEYPGTGLGLAMCQKIVERYGGRIRVESGLWGGINVSLYYARAKPMKECTIVLIEDNPADVLLVELALKENDVICRMITFTNGQQALRSLCPPKTGETHATVPDAILLDLNTPKSDGFEVLIQLRATPHLANVPIAIITSSQATSDKARTDRLGAVRYIHKPSQLEEFIATVGQAVKEMLGQDRPPGRAENMLTRPGAAARQPPPKMQTANLLEDY